MGWWPRCSPRWVKAEGNNKDLLPFWPATPAPQRSTSRRWPIRITCTTTLPGATLGTCTVSCVADTAKTGACTPPNVTQIPASLVPNLPPDNAPLTGADPVAAKFDP